MYKENPILRIENILLGQASTTQEEAIKLAGKLLIDSGYVSSEYTEAMFKREEIVSTYIGMGVAIPHGVGKERNLIKSSGIVVIQYPEGINYNGEKCYLVIGISGKDNEHIKILANIAEHLSDEETVYELWKTSDVDYVYNLFTK